jgi:dihydrofolate synthase/folylpolyglutamate synthase
VYLSSPLADPFERLSSLEALGVKLGLDNIGRLCAALGNPERSFPTIHIAGTNGKGSVTAFVHAALLEAGYRAARYTSPHLTDLAERFVIGAAHIDTSTLAETATAVLDLTDRLVADGRLGSPPTFFEVTTAIAFELFRRAAVDVAVIEVGLGGRFDATNVIAPVAGAVTSIAFDHEQQLGSSLGAIAFEKAGIIKAGMPIVVGALPGEAIATIRHVSAERGARLIDASGGSHVHWNMVDGRARISVTTPDDRYGPLTLALRGQHQIGNAVVAIRLLETARRAGFAHLTAGSIERGLSTAEWPARLELLMLPDNRRVLLDAAHNVEGAQALASYLAEWHAERPTLVVGIMRDKDVKGILCALLPVTSAVIATRPPSVRALTAAELAADAKTLDPVRDVQAHDDSLTAVEEALVRDNTICVAGSIFLVGAVREALRRRAILQ